LLLGLFVTGVSLAGDLKIYDVAGQFQAPFSAPPTSVGSFDYQGNTFHAYSAADQDLGIGYTAMFPERAQQHFSEDQQIATIKNFVLGLAEWSNGTLITVTAYSCDAVQCADYVIKKVTQGVEIRTHGKVIYKNDRFFVWGIKEFLGLSSADSARLFQSAKASFRVF
jgi:hypothetical protein